ncbi:MAG: hypothetical protein JSV68_11710 [Anaerolineaceae bacterium]|nr:MAG: hypothetical protein JSV68_11710 [Anaerolineaceae bacterium]
MRIVELNYELRPAVWQDVAKIVRLSNASARDTRGRNGTADHWLKRHWYDAGIELERDSLLISTSDGTVAEFAQLTR